MACYKHDIDLSVTLMDCNHSATKSGNERIKYGRRVGYLQVEADPDCNTLSTQILLRKISGVCKNVEFAHQQQ